MEVGTQRGSELGDDKVRVSLKLPEAPQESRSRLHTTARREAKGRILALEEKVRGAWETTGPHLKLEGGLPHRWG